MDWLANWGPMLLLIGLWIFFIAMMYRKGSPAQRSLAEQRRHNDVLEKILASHEARLQKLEDDKPARSTQVSTKAAPAEQPAR
jgi:hypothetical protein